MEDLLDVRGYEIKLKSSAGGTVRVHYLGPVQAEHSGLRYDEDPYVVSRVGEESFSGSYAAAVKDPGIRKTGLKLVLEAERDTAVTVEICGEACGEIRLQAGISRTEILDVRGLCRSEKEYLEKVHRIMRGMLREVDRICGRHGLHYYLVYGGLLGVLRHGDIIPWDDDVDIAMTRADFEKFRELAGQELGSDYSYLDCADLGDAYLDFICRILYMKKTVTNRIFDKVRGRCREGVDNRLYLDIFIMDNAADQERRHKRQMFLLRGIYGLAMGHRAYIDKKEYAGCSLKTRLAVSVLSAAGRRIPLEKIFSWHDRVSQRYNGTAGRDYFLSNSYLPYVHNRYRKTWFAGGDRTMLGDTEVCVPKDIPAALKKAYYDYYHYPPMNRRKPDHSLNEIGEMS